jgi:hypothetical protein
MIEEQEIKTNSTLERFDIRLENNQNFGTVNANDYLTVYRYVKRNIAELTLLPNLRYLHLTVQFETNK